MSLEVAATVKKDSYGATWEVDTDLDLTDSTSVKLTLRDESGNTSLVTGSVKSPATGGIILWTEPEGIWDKVGYWRMESVSAFSGGLRYGNQALVKVVADLNG